MYGDGTQNDEEIHEEHDTRIPRHIIYSHVQAIACQLRLEGNDFLQ